MIPAHGNVPGAVHPEKLSAVLPAGFLPCIHTPYSLAGSDLVSGLCPGFILPQQERYGNRIFPRFLLFAEGKRVHPGGKGGHIGFDLPAGNFLSVLFQHRHTAETGCGSKHVPVDNFHFFRIRPDHDILVIVFDFLQLRSFPAVRKHDAVSAENAVGGPVVPVSAVLQGFFAVRILAGQGLIDKIPDKAALEMRLFFCVLGVFMHSAVGIAHGMGILTENERFLPVFFEIGADFFGRRIHFRFNVRDFPQAQRRIKEIHLVVPLIMYGPGGIQVPEFPAHGQDYRSGQALIAAGPDQNTGMVPVI